MTTPDAVAGPRGPQRCEVGGIPTWWEDAGAPLVRAALVFRVGVVDETAATRGITHLVEHLAMPPGVVRHMVDANASVDATHTSFYVDGTPDEVAEFLTGVLERLADPPVERIELERRVLLAEADLRTGVAVEALATFRYGMRGFGLAGVAEDGLHRLGADDVRAWTAERFCRRNAVLLISAPPPQLPALLPEGRRRPLPHHSQRGPSRVKLDGAGNGATVTLTGPPTPAFRAACRILGDRAEEVLRHERGLSYAVTGEWVPLGDTVHAMLGGASLERDSAAMLEGLLRIVDDIAENGPAPAELEADRATARRELAARDPSARVAYAALAELDGDEPVALADAVALDAQVTAEEIAAAVAEARSTLLLAAGDDVPVPDGFATDAPPPSFPHDGVRYRERALFRAARMTVGDDAVTLAESGMSATLRREDLVLLLRYQDGGRVLVDVNGTWVQAVPDEWRNGDDLGRRLDRFAPPELHVAMPERLRDQR